MISDKAGRNTMGWTGGHLEGPFTARAAIEFGLGAESAARVIDTASCGSVIYAAVRSNEGNEVFGLVLLTERRDGVLHTKPISEDMGPDEDRCPARILDHLTEPSNEYAHRWRQRCRARLTKSSHPSQMTGVASSSNSPATSDSVLDRSAPGLNVSWPSTTR